MHRKSTPLNRKSQWATHSTTDREKLKQIGVDCIFLLAFLFQKYVYTKSELFTETYTHKPIHIYTYMCLYVYKITYLSNEFVTHGLTF